MDVTYLWNLVNLFDSHHLTRYIDGFDAIRLFECGNAALKTRLQTECISLVFETWDCRFWDAAKFMSFIARHFLQVRQIKFDFRRHLHPFRKLNNYNPNIVENVVPLQLVFPNLRQLVLKERDGSLIACSMGRFFLQQAKSIHTTFPVLEKLHVHLEKRLHATDRQLEIASFLEYTPATVHDTSIWAPMSWGVCVMPSLDVMRDEQPKLKPDRFGVCLVGKSKAWQTLDQLYDFSHLTRLKLQLSINVALNCSHLPRNLQSLVIHGTDFHSGKFISVRASDGNPLGPIICFDDPPPHLAVFVAQAAKVVVLAHLPPWMQIFRVDSLLVDEASLISIDSLPKTLLRLEFYCGLINGAEKYQSQHLFEPLIGMSQPQIVETLKRWPPKLRLVVDPEYSDALLHQFGQNIYYSSTVLQHNFDSTTSLFYSDSECQKPGCTNYYISLLSDVDRANPKSLWLRHFTTMISDHIHDSNQFLNLLMRTIRRMDVSKLIECPPNFNIEKIDATVYSSLTAPIVAHLFPLLNKMLSCEKFGGPIPKQFTRIRTMDTSVTSFEDPASIISLHCPFDDNIDTTQKWQSTLTSIINLKHAAISFPLLANFMETMNDLPKSIETLVIKSLKKAALGYHDGPPLPVERICAFNASHLPPNLRYLDVRDFDFDKKSINLILQSIKKMRSLHQLVLSFTGYMTNRFESFTWHVHSVDLDSKILGDNHYL